MIEALQEHRGSCEPVSHLLAATLFDLGHGERTRLRFYGGSAGAKHLTVILSGTGEKKAPQELDLLSGQGPEPGGASFPADELVEAWARNHGLAPRTARLAASADTFVPNGVPDTRTLTAGYPENGDKFGGPLPLYADRAVSPVSPPGSPPRTVFDAPPCPFHVHVAWLDPPRAEAQAREHTSVVLHRQPSKAELERVATNIYAVESRKKSDLASRLMDQACLAAMHDNAATLFSLAGQPRVAERAASEAAAARQLGAQALSEWDALSVSEKGALAKRLDEQSLGRTWTLLFLQGGERVVLPLAEKESSSFVRTAALMALLVHPATRSRALALANQLPLSEQIDVMHELMHTHDHQRPWAASYFMDLAPAQATGPFPRMYRVFAALWWRLWDAQLPPERVIAALVSEAQAQHLERPALEAIATYYMKSFYRLVASRAGGPALVERAAKAAEAAGLPGKGVLSQEDLEGRVTKPTRTPK